jgi:hypothetical protein
MFAAEQSTRCTHLIMAVNPAPFAAGMTQVVKHHAGCLACSCNSLNMVLPVASWELHGRTGWQLGGQEGNVDGHTDPARSLSLKNGSERTVKFSCFLGYANVESPLLALIGGCCVYAGPPAAKAAAQQTIAN